MKRSPLYKCRSRLYNVCKASLLQEGIMKEHGDLRKTRSRQYLVEALIRLMNAKTIDEISVQNLVEEAQVARSTFYSQFEDKQDFLDTIVEEIFLQLRKETRPDSYAKEPGLNSVNSCKYYVKHFDYIAKHADFFRVMLGRNGLPAFRQKMEESARITYTEILSSFSDDDLTLPKPYLIQYIISAHIGMTSKWLEDGMKYSPSYLAELLTHLTYQGVFHGLELERIVALPK